jgi:hypothetical protein
VTGPLELISAVRDIVLDDFSHICLRLEETHDGKLLSEQDAWRYRLVRDQLYVLGHIELDYQNRKIRAARPRFALLPPAAEDKSGSWNAVLTGARSVTLANNIKGRRANNGVRVDSCKSGPDDLLPERIVVEGSAEGLKRLAGQLHISFDCSLRPEAWMALHHCLDMGVFRDSVSRGASKPGEPPEQALCYEPRSGRFCRWTEIRKDYQPVWGLAQRKLYDYYLFCRENRTENPIQFLDRLQCDPNWGRWLVNANRIDTLFNYDAGKKSLKIPNCCPLPAELARVACLCSGYASVQDQGEQVYRDVNPLMASSIKSKLVSGE